MTHKKYRLNSRLEDLLRSIEISHWFAMKYNHGIQLRDKWDLFEPTRFVYSFFAFNMIYSIDWDKSVNSSRVSYQKSDNNNHSKKQIMSLLQFICKHDKQIFESELNKIDINRELYSVVKEMEYDYNSNSDNYERKTGNSIKEDFLTASNKFSSETPLELEDIFDLIQMSYAVRNNLFHGEKKAHQMRENGHRKRLLHYGNIIIAINESFFETIKENYDYRRVENWEVQDNF
jgi:hypothetical protein